MVHSDRPKHAYLSPSSLHVAVHLPSLHDVRFELEDCLRRRNSPVFFLKSHGSEMESVQFVFPNGFDFGVAK